VKKFVTLFSFALFLVALILLPISSTGKFDVSKPLTVDGSPLPWPIPPSSAVMADGYPLPPPIPPRPGKLGSTATSFVADGYPLPPPIPHAGSVATLIADGYPLPPPIPPGGSAASHAT
jgi:hypothetical protein